MKKVLFAVIPCMLTLFSFHVMAQEDVTKTKDKKETEEIIIRKKGDKDANITIQINGDKVTVNGKPLIEFKDDNVSVNKRKIIVRDGENMWHGDLNAALAPLENLNWNMDGDDREPVAFLGVTTEKNKDGAKIIELNKESAAAKAGLLKDDVVIKFGDTKIDGPESLSEAVRAKKPKDEVKIVVLRDGKEKTFKASLQERKNSRVFSYSGPDGSYKTLTIPPTPQMRGLGEEYAELARTYNGENFNFYRRQKLGLKIQDTEDGTGVKVLEVEDSSAAALAGLKKDDILTQVGGEKVNNTDEAREQLQENREKSLYNIKALRNGKEMSFDIKIPKKLKTANL